ncbi:MAG: ferrous iron transport protein [Clostridiales bacterium]|jgi:ferrous iron transport protein B|nr:ferrous iron transport protein [Clostridiales bacterium]MDN5281472.1 ferrous iron transport protein [Candidatus Ozemobacter sp.]
MNTETIKQKRVFLIGNPNSGKTSLFNALTGERKRVGNWPGVTVQKIEGIIKTGSHKLVVNDLPGTYSLSPATPEEEIVLKTLDEASGNVILNVVDIGNFERNLFLTTQLIELGISPVVSLNCFDTFTAGGGNIDLNKFTRLTGISAFPTIARTGEGVTSLTEHLAGIDNCLITKPCSCLRLPEDWISAADRILGLNGNTWKKAGPVEKFKAIRLLIAPIEENNPEQIEKLRIIREELAASISERTGKDLKAGDLACELASDRYQRIEMLIAECATVPGKTLPPWQEKLDSILTNRWLGLPIFALLMGWVFYTTFSIGEYPMGWLESLFTTLSTWIEANMNEGLVRSLIVEGVIAGVGGVLVFVPNILILFFWIALLEDSGYMSRAAFLMDRLMNSIGLHGRAFIPMIMGLGCNVPAVMATRIIDNRFQRLLTMLLIPLITCAARLPVLVILCGTFFGDNASFWMFTLFFVNLLVLIFLGQATSLLFKTEENSPFLLEMPPYRLPTASSVFHMLYEKVEHFVEKAGTIILAGSIIIWVLSVFPRDVPLSKDYDSQIVQLKSGPVTNETAGKIAELTRQKNIEQMEGRYMARIGKAIHPIMKPLGFSWRETVSLIPGFLAKESVVSTLSVLYLPFDENLGDAMKISGMNKLSAFVFMLFTLMYIPCIATLGVIWRESGSTRFTLMALVVYFFIAYAVSFFVLKISTLLTSSGQGLIEGAVIVLVVLFAGWYIIRTFLKAITGSKCKSCAGCQGCPVNQDKSCSGGS